MYRYISLSISLYVYIYIYICIAGPRGAEAAGDLRRSGQNITHQKSQKRTSIGNATDNPWVISSKSPLDEGQSFGNFHRQVEFRWKMLRKIHWKTPLKIHDDF